MRGILEVLLHKRSKFMFEVPGSDVDVTFKGGGGKRWFNLLYDGVDIFRDGFGAITPIGLVMRHL
jgi:hypothetical protein